MPFQPQSSGVTFGLPWHYGDVQAWTEDPMICSSTTILGTGVAEYVRCSQFAAFSLSTFFMFVTNASVAASLVKCGLYRLPAGSTTLTQLAVSTDQSAAFNATGGNALLSLPATVATQVPYVADNDLLYLAFLTVFATTGATIARPNAPNSGAYNTRTTAQRGVRAGSIAGQADLPATQTLAGLGSTNAILIMAA